MDLLKLAAIIVLASRGLLLCGGVSFGINVVWVARVPVPDGLRWKLGKEKRREKKRKGEQRDF